MFGWDLLGLVLGLVLGLGLGWGLKNGSGPFSCANNEPKIEAQRSTSFRAYFMSEV